MLHDMPHICLPFLPLCVDSLAIVVIILIAEGDSMFLVQRSDLSWAPLCIPCRILQQSCGHGLGQCLCRGSFRSNYTAAAAILYDCCSSTCGEALLTLQPTATVLAHSKVLVQSCAVDPGAVSSNIYANSRLPSPVRWVIRNLHAPTSDGASAVIHAATTRMMFANWNDIPMDVPLTLEEIPVFKPLRVGPSVSVCRSER